MPKVLWTIKAIENLTPEDIGKMKEADLERLVKATRKQAERRIRNIENKGLYSHAANRHEEKILNKEYMPDPRVMTINQMRAEMASHQAFFASKTSTVKGIKEVNREQDLRIFGPKKEGSKIPLYTMTTEQRSKYWALYNEFESRHRAANFDSNRVQEIVQQEFDNLAYSDPIFDDPNLFGKIVDNAFIRMELENGPVYENGHRVTAEALGATYTSGQHDLNYWRQFF